MHIAFGTDKIELTKKMQKNISLGVVYYPLGDYYECLVNALFEIKRKNWIIVLFYSFPFIFKFAFF